MASIAGDAPVVRTRTIVDVDGLGAAITDDLATECVQLESKPFVAQHVVVTLPRMVVQFVGEDVAVARRIRVPDGKWLFLVPLVVTESARWNARRVAMNNLFVHAPGSECFAFDPAGTRFALISVAEGSDLAVCARTVLTDGIGECTLVAHSHDARALRRELDLVRAWASTVPGVDEIHHATAALDTAMRRAMKSQQYVYKSADHKGVVRRAEDFFRRHIGERVSTARLSSAARVSERQLRNAFYGVYAISPIRYLRLWQLHQARRALRSRVDRAVSVTDVATSHGFYELGRFAVEYKALFGESPSKTLGHRPWAASRVSAPSSSWVER